MSGVVMTGPETGKNATDRVSAVLSRAAIRDFAQNINSVRIKGRIRTTIRLRSWADPGRILTVLDSVPGSAAWWQGERTIVVTWDSNKVGAE